MTCETCKYFKSIKEIESIDIGICLDEYSLDYCNVICSKKCECNNHEYKKETKTFNDGEIP
jgi:hypothetical protein